MIKIKKRHRIIPVSYILLVKGGKILLARRCNTGYMDGCWSVPAGHFEGGEAARQVAVREAMEETGVVIKKSDLDIVHVMNRKGHDGIENERVDFYFTARKWKGEPKIMELDKCDGMNWFSMEKLPKKMAPEVRQAIKYFRKGIFYSEFGW